MAYITARAATGRALVAIDPQLSQIRNYFKDPEFDAALPDQVEPIGGAYVSRTGKVAGQPGQTGSSDAYMQVIQSSPGTTQGVRVTAYADDLMQAGNLLYLKVRVTPFGFTLRVTLSCEGGGTATQDVASGTTSLVTLQASLGASRKATVTMLPATAPNIEGPQWRVYELNLLSRNVAGFSGATVSDMNGLYRWLGQAYASTSEKSIPVVSTMSVYRLVDGTRTLVRGTDKIRALSITLSDNDVPLNRAVRYELVLSDGTRLQSNTVYVQSVPPALGNRESWPILSEPVTGKSARVAIVAWDQLDFARNSKLIRVPGRREPVVITDIEQSPESSPKLLTLTDDDAATLAALMADGSTLLLRSPCPGVEDAYVHVSSRSATRFAPAAASSQTRVHDLKVTEVAPADMDMLGRGDTLGDIEDRFRTLGDLDDADLIGGF